MVEALRNYSEAFIAHSTGSALKNDNDKKHSKPDMHLRAVNLSSGIR